MKERARVLRLLPVVFAAAAVVVGVPAFSSPEPVSPEAVTASCPGGLPCMEFPTDKVTITWTGVPVTDTAEVIRGRLRSPVCVGGTFAGAACPLGTECLGGVCAPRDPICAGGGGNPGVPCPRGNECIGASVCTVCVVGGGPCSPAMVDLSSVLGTEGNFNPTVYNCVADNSPTPPATTTDTMPAPPPGGVYYYLVRNGTPPANDTWSTGVVTEIPGAGAGTRNNDLDGLPNGPVKAPNTCATPPP